MKIKISGLYSSLLLIFTFIFFSGCDGSNENKIIPPKVEVVTLSVDKNKIKSDGIDFTTFSVIADNVDVSGKAVIINKSEGDKTITDGIFLTNTPGTYTFYSVYEDVTSATIEVEVLSANLLLNSDVTTIKADGISNVTFSVTEYDEDITDNAEIFYIGNDETEVKLEGNIFNTTEEGIFKFFGKHNENVSDTLSIEVAPLVLILIPDVTTIKANGTDIVSFIVMLDEEDVTEVASVYIENGDNDYVIENKAFSTEKEGMYEFYATYNDRKSDNVTVEAVVYNLVITPPNKETFRTGEVIAFTAISNYVDDVSTEVELVIIKDGKEQVISGNKFTPPSFGKYSIYARYEDKVSKTVDLNILVATVTLSVDKTELKSSGSDFAQFTVYADGIRVDDGEVYVRNAYGDQILPGNRFSTGVFDTYTFYARFQDVKSGNVSVVVYKTPFVKQSVVMEVVATWCGFSAEMMEICRNIHESDISERILPVSLHRPTSGLVSLDIDADALLTMFNQTGIPLGVMDLDRRLFRNINDFENSHVVMKQIHPVTSGVAITSQQNEYSINVTLRVKANEAGNYSVGAMIVEDNVVKGQTIYPGGDKTKSYTDQSFVHHGVATYIMPNSSIYPGILLGSIGGGREITRTFSIDLNRKVVDRTVNYDNCRVVAYVMKFEGSKYYINNSATCPVNGSVGYNHE